MTSKKAIREVIKAFNLSLMNIIDTGAILRLIEKEAEMLDEEEALKILILKK